jgi:hypothetical protein
MAIEAAIVLQIILLQAFSTTAGAYTAGVDPVSIAIETILDMIFVYNYLQLIRKVFRIFPRGYLELQEFEVRPICSMIE